MNPKQIIGKYNLIADIDSEFILHGDNHNLTVYNQDQTLLFNVLNNIRFSKGTPVFLANTKIKIEKIRMFSRLAPGLRGECNLFLKFYDGVNINESFTKNIDIPYFGEWVDCGITVEPYKEAVSKWGGIDEDQVWLSLVGGTGRLSTKMFLDDFNVQDEYIGETIPGFTLQMIVDTAGMKNALTNEVF